MADNLLITRSFKQKEFWWAPLESLVLQSEQYHPVAQTNLHKGLKCKIKINKSVRPQSTVPFSIIKLAWAYMPVPVPGSLFFLVLVHKSLGIRLGHQEASRILMKSWPGSEQFSAIQFEVLSLRLWNSFAWTNVNKRKSNMSGRIHWRDLDCQVKLIANLLHSFYSAVISKHKRLLGC